MPRVLVTDEDGTVVAWDERVTSADFETEHSRRQLSERLGWAVADARHADARVVDARIVDARVADARVADARVADGRIVDARLAPRALKDAEW